VRTLAFHRAVSESLRRFRRRLLARRLRVAVVTCLPPAESGIASTSEMIYSAMEVSTDVFAEFPAPEDIDALTRKYGANALVRWHHVKSLEEALRTDRYSAIILTLGNSAHHMPAVRVMRRLASISADVPIIVHLHDPFLVGLLAPAAAEEGIDLRGLIASVYGPLPDFSAKALADAGALGLRALLRGWCPDTFIVHSSAARRHVLRELPGVRVDVLTHPKYRFVAEPGWTPISNPRAPVFGSFGIPHAAKLTHVVLAAFELVRTEVPGARLLLAGYNAGAYFTGAVPPGVEVIASPSDLELRDLMRRTDVAIQLRAADLGETSGIVGQLLQEGVHTIVSRIGSLSELGDRVTYVERSSTSQDIANKMVDALGHPRPIKPVEASGFDEDLVDLILEIVRDRSDPAQRPASLRNWWVRTDSNRGPAD
jgi:hypothetical protein